MALSLPRQKILDPFRFCRTKQNILRQDLIAHAAKLVPPTVNDRIAMGTSQSALGRSEVACKGSTGGTAPRLVHNPDGRRKFNPAIRFFPINL